MNSLLQFRVQGKPQIQKALETLPKALDTQAILDEGSAVLLHHTLTRFLAQQDPSGATWPPSKAAERRQRTGVGGGTLFDKGNLFRSIQLYAEGPDARAIGTDRTSSTGFPYPKVHQFGLAGFPERQFLGFGDEDVALMSEVIVHRISQVLTS